jgi:hypothetical protein
MRIPIAEKARGIQWYDIVIFSRHYNWISLLMCNLLLQVPETSRDQNVASYMLHTSMQTYISVRCHGYTCPFILIKGSFVAFYENKNTGNCGSIIEKCLFKNIAL